MIAGSSHVIFIAETEGTAETAPGGASGSKREKESTRKGERSH